MRNNMTTPKKPRTKLKPFRARMTPRGDGKVSWVVSTDKKLVSVWRDMGLEIHEVLCTPVAPRKRKAVRK